MKEPPLSRRLSHCLVPDTPEGVAAITRLRAANEETRSGSPASADDNETLDHLLSIGGRHRDDRMIRVLEKSKSSESF